MDLKKQYLKALLGGGFCTVVQPMHIQSGLVDTQTSLVIT